MQGYFGYELRFLTTIFRAKPLRVFDYLTKAVWTIALLWREKPDIAWVQVAPIFAAQAAIIYKTLFQRDLILIADCHNSAFTPPWSKLPFAVSTLNKMSLLLAHNEDVAKEACAAGLRSDIMHVLETRPARLAAEAAAPAEKNAEPVILFPCSFRPDEPVQSLLDAARAMPEARFQITGDVQRMNADGAMSDLPANVTHEGYVSVKKFNDLLQRCDLVVGLTVRNNTQLSVANEAAGAGKPMVISDTETLRALFGKGAVFVDSTDPESIRQGCRYALEHKEDLARDVCQLRDWRENRWTGQAEGLKARLPH